jgi:hypothetical protein
MVRLDKMDESMSCSDGKSDLVTASAEPSRRRPMMLCSLRIVPVSSEHFSGRRYVMELATSGQARELRVYRSLEQLMSGVEELGLSAGFRDGLYRQMLEEGSCQLLDIVL